MYLYISTGWLPTRPPSLFSEKTIYLIKTLKLRFYNIVIMLEISCSYFDL